MLDRHLFYYGRSDFNLYSPLPLKINPEYRLDNEGHFVLRDEFGFSIAGKGNTYKLHNSKITIEHVLKYGFNDEKLIAVVEDRLKRKYYVEFSTDHDNLMDNEINVRVNSIHQKLEGNLYKWIEVKGNERYIERLETFRNYIMFTTILAITAVLVLVVRRSTKKPEGTKVRSS